MNLQPPAPFCFHKTDEWPKWKRRFDQYRQASGLVDKVDERQVSTLLYCLGDDAEDVLNTTRITPEDKKKYSKVLDAFDEHFKVRKNIIFEWARFNKRCQLPNESVEQFITEVHRLGDSCEFGLMKEELIRDRLVVGIRDHALSERLQMEAELTLDKAKRLIRQREAVKEQQELLKQPTGDDTSLGAVAKTVPRRKLPAIPSSAMQQPLAYQNCRRCGKSSHPRQSCPAKDVLCYRCNRKGHYGSQCLSNTVAPQPRGVHELSRQSEQSESETTDKYLDTVVGSKKNMWSITIQLQGKPIVIKVDTGAEVTAISDSTWKSLKIMKPLEETEISLYGPDNTNLKILGKINLTLTHDQRSCTQDVYIIKDLKSDLLGLPAIKELELLLNVCSVGNGKSIISQYPSLFTGLGTFACEYTIKIKPNSQPFALNTPRNIPLPQRSKVKCELQRMQSLGVISPVEQPTPWCAAMVVVPKDSGAVRICVDLKPLNENVLREVHPMPKVDITLAQLSGATVFSKLDANSGFWQIPLAEESKLLTTFITPFGRFCFNKLPFGISSAPEIFQRQMNNVLSGLPGVLCHVDDILVYGKDSAEHESRLQATLKRIQAAGITLNESKCCFYQSCVSFLGHVIDKHGISPDPKKTTAILGMTPPTSVTELRRFMGMINQMNKFSPNIAHMSKPLRELLSSKNSWMWTTAQEEAFTKLKKEVSSPRVLALYDVDAKTKVSADASAYGIGAVLMQQQQGVWRPVAFASRTLNEAETRYAQIEKEALALTWALEKFAEYVLGKCIILETDHKPLVPILGRKSLDMLPPRVLRFRLRLMRFQYVIQHVPGKTLYTADTLSRAPLKEIPDANSSTSSQEIEQFVQAITAALPASPDRLDSYRKAQAEDSICSRLIEYCASGWPNRSKLSRQLKDFWRYRGELTLSGTLLLYQSRIVIPESMRQATLGKIHHGHQGILRCRMRVSTFVWWPGISKDMEAYVKSCPVCQKTTTLHKEPLISTPLPNHPWERIASDLFELKNSTYLLTVDYYSRYAEVQKLSSTTSSSVITHLKSIFARFGVPAEMVSDNGPQYSSQEMKDFSENYGFKHITTSPHYPQANGLAERTVKTVKNLLENASDPYKALLSYRATPLPWCALSPAELLMGRRIRTDIPQVMESFVPKWSHIANFRSLDEKYKRLQKQHYDQRHRVKTLPSLPDDQPVWVETRGVQTPGRVSHAVDVPRSYVVETDSSQLRRNRSHLRTRSEVEQAVPAETVIAPSRPVTRSQTGTVVRPPDRLWY